MSLQPRSAAPAAPAPSTPIAVELHGRDDPASRRLADAFDAVIRSVADRVSESPERREWLVADLQDAVAVYVALRKADGAPPERVLVGVKDALSRPTARPTPQPRPARAGAAVDAIVFQAFLTAYYGVSAPPGDDAGSRDRSNAIRHAAADTDGLRDHVDRSPFGIVMVDGPTHRIRYANPAFTRLGGIEGLDGVGRPLADVVPAPMAAPLTQLLGRAQRHGEPQMEVELIGEPTGTLGSGVAWSVTVWPVLDADGDPDHLVVQLRDVTDAVRERQRAAGMADALREATDALHEMGERLARVSLREAVLRESASATRRQPLCQPLHDPLTGLANRTLFADRVSHALARAARDQTTPAVLSLVIDGCSGITDQRGHTAGDPLLRAAAERLRGAVRTSDTVAHFGGAAFAILLEGPHADQPTADAIEVTRRILAALRAPLEVAGQPRTLDASVGLAVGGSVSADTLLRRADRALYAAQARGGGQPVLFAPAMDGALAAAPA